MYFSDRCTKYCKILHSKNLISNYVQIRWSSSLLQLAQTKADIYLTNIVTAGVGHCANCTMRSHASQRVFHHSIVKLFLHYRVFLNIRMSHEYFLEFTNNRQAVFLLSLQIYELRWVMFLHRFYVFSLFSETRGGPQTPKLFFLSPRRRLCHLELVCVRDSMLMVSVNCSRLKCQLKWKFPECVSDNSKHSRHIKLKVF